MLHAHTYGTNGIVLELEIALAPSQRWDEYLLAFPDHASAFSCAHALAQAPGIAKKNIAMFSDQVVQHIAKLAPSLDAGEHAVIAVMTPPAREPLARFLAAYGGRIALHQDAEAARSNQHTLLEYCWNHTTLHALRQNSNITNLEAFYTYGQEREQLENISRAAGAEVLDHIEFIRDMLGRVICVGLPLIRFTTEARLDELIALHRAHGIQISSPHIYTLEDGKHGGALAPAILASMRAFDPHGLLNPGKVRSVRPR